MLVCCFKKIRSNRPARKFISQTEEHEVDSTSLGLPEENVFKLVNQAIYLKCPGVYDKSINSLISSIAVL